MFAASGHADPDKGNDTDTDTEVTVPQETWLRI
jgi:hypothetical protein